MAAQFSVVPAMPANGAACRLIVREEQRLTEVIQFLLAGLEMGQQVVALAGARFLKDLAQGFSENGFRPDPLLRSGRLVFLTAPNCLSQFVKPQNSFERTTLRRNGSLVRWVSDWSWAYGNGQSSETILAYQRLVHDYVRIITPLSLCTVHCENLERSSLLAMLADHRRAAKTRTQA